MAEKNVCVQIAVSETLAFLNLTVESVPETQGICSINDISRECTVVALLS